MASRLLTGFTSFTQISKAHCPRTSSSPELWKWIGGYIVTAPPSGSIFLSSAISSHFIVG